MEKLSRSASGARHVRWAREILTTLRAHHEVNKQLTDTQKQALAAEIERVETRIHALAESVVPYRDFIEHAHIDVRARQRVADYLCDDAQRRADGDLRGYRKEIDSILPGGYASIFSKTPLSRVLRAGREKTVELAERAASMVRTLPARIPGTALIADRLDEAASLLGGFNEQAKALDDQRQPLRMAVHKATFELREELDQMDGRLRSHFTQIFIDSLYPELSRKGTAIADDTDEDDDAATPPEG
ncbi:hypothetical protein [Polyangium aurulentum]|uniref:hypothetical protein n=1 Tax=Polyangium aurulentum TaxID=2567896 RepID=UPI0010AE6828|nr:hypothetical protein [Polyangium aurulentum]UQA58240.1 hypothetical protein E8A73_044495 [Polyangium aurulentum]